MEYSTFVFLMIYQNIIVLGSIFMVYLFTKFAKLKPKIATKIVWGIVAIWAVSLLIESIYISYMIPGG